MPKTPPTKDLSGRNPFAGCAIFIAAFLVMVFLIGFSILTLFRQYNEIEKFTSDKPVPVEVAVVSNQEIRLNALAERVEKFRQDLTGDEVATLRLSADDVNLAIAAHDEFKELRGTFRIGTIEGGKLRIPISFPLNGRPRLAQKGEPGWIASDSRFLNATLIARPVLNNKEVLLAIDAIEVPGVSVPRGFIDQMSPYRITERYLVDHGIGKAMARLTKVEIDGDQVVLSRNPKETAAGTITNAEVDSASTRLFKVIGTAACGFLAFAAVIILLGVRSKSRKDRNS